jgi:hypothetical protein
LPMKISHAAKTEFYWWIVGYGLWFIIYAWVWIIIASLELNQKVTGINSSESCLCFCRYCSLDLCRKRFDRMHSDWIRNFEVSLEDYDVKLCMNWRVTCRNLR